MTASAVTLRWYQSADEAACLELWRRSWQVAYPGIDFTARLDWWRERWRNELVPVAKVVVAERDGALAGFVTVDPRTGYLDQIVVAPEAWGSPVAAALIAEAKRIAPDGLELYVNEDNARAIRFYRRSGFVPAGAGAPSLSGAATYRMVWRPPARTPA